MKKIFIVLAAVFTLAACKQINYTSLVDYHLTKGDDSAKVKIVEWGDFQCPACGKAYEALHPVFEQYKDKIQVQYRHFPLTSIHPLAFNAAMASECATDQGMFWQYHDKLFASQPDLKKDDLFNYAKQLGLDMDKFTACYDSRAKNQVIKDDMAEANNLNLNSTPTFFYNGEQLQNWSIIPQLLSSQFPADPGANQEQ